MRRLFMWFLLLNKRLYKKVSFILILLLIPVLVLSYSSAAQESSGVITIALAQVGKDEMASGVMQTLMDNTKLIRFLPCATAQEARDMVANSDADAAWILPEDMEQKVYRFIATRKAKDAFVQVIERESNVALILAREELSGAVFTYCSQSLYMTYLRENVSELDGVSDEELMRFYHNAATDDRLFEHAAMESSQSPQETEEANYLLTPVRGLLAVVTVLSALAAAMYYMHDDAVGTFAWVPQRKKAIAEFGFQMICVLNVAVVSLIGLFFSKLTVSLGREALILLLYAVCVVLFSMTLRRLCGKLTVVGTLLPLLVVIMLVVCPVFFDLGPLRTVQYLFPPTYYIHAQYSNRHFLLMGVYCIVLLPIYYLSGKLLHRK